MSSLGLTGQNKAKISLKVKKNRNTLGYLYRNKLKLGVESHNGKTQYIDRICRELSIVNWPNWPKTGQNCRFEYFYVKSALADN